MNQTYRLKNVYIHITEQCEHFCPFCYAANGLGSFGNADIETIKRIVDVVSNDGIERISLVGGDPVLHPKIEEIVNYIKSKKGIQICLMTNTARFERATFNRIANAFNSVMVTIHGKNAQIHDQICGVEGAYDDLVSNLFQFDQINIPIEIAYNITPYSYDQLYSSIEAIIAVGIHPKKVLLQRIAPSSQTRLNEEYSVNGEQANIALRSMERIITELNIPTELVDPFPLCYISKNYWYLVKQCKCGFCDLSINGNGDTSRCGADPTYTMGNILNTSLKEIWGNAEDLCNFRERKYLPDKCKLCDIVEQCAGGCPLSCTTYNSIAKSHLSAFEKRTT